MAIIRGKTRYGLDTGQELEVEFDNNLTFGRNHKNTINDVDLGDFVIYAIARSISRKHLSVSKQDGQYFVADLGSRYGTDLNGNALEPHNPVEIKNGDVISVPSGKRSVINLEFYSE